MRVLERLVRPEGPPLGWRGGGPACAAWPRERQTWLCRRGNVAAGWLRGLPTCTGTVMIRAVPMRVSYLGGETGHRGLLGMGSASRGRMTALSVAAVAAGIATIYLGVGGLAVGLIAAAVVLLATARTPAGSVWTRAQARRRWRERTRSGTVAFRPVAARPSGPLPGVPETVWRAAPDGLEGMSWLQTTPGRPGIAWHAPTGEDPYLSVAYAVDGQLQGLAGDHTVDQAARRSENSWPVMAALCPCPAGCRR